RPGVAAEHRGVPAFAARADAEREPPARDIVERDQLLRERHRVPEVRRGDQRSEPDVLGDTGRRGQRRYRAEPRAVAQRSPCEVVVRPRVIEAELLRAPPGVARACPRMLGKNDNAEAHRRTLPTGASAFGQLRCSFSFTESIASSALSLRSSTISFALPLARSALPSRLSRSSSVRSPAASLARPFRSSVFGDMVSRLVSVGGMGAPSREKPPPDSSRVP